MKRKVEGARLSSESTLVLFNIPKEIQDELVLIEACSMYGPVANCRLKYDRETGASKGWAFVEFYNREHAEAFKRELTGPIKARWASGWNQDKEESENN
jgi:RNA recognition motif-containing protein